MLQSQMRMPKDVEVTQVFSRQHVKYWNLSDYSEIISNPGM